MPKSVAQLVDELIPDLWRERVGFSQEIRRFSERLLNPTKSDSELAQSLREWLAAYQPCLFGRVAAGESDQLSFCILTERDLLEGDRKIRDKIQEYRLQWKRDALQGLKSGFVILAASHRILDAAPDDGLMHLGIRLAELYLRETVSPDQIHLEHVALRLSTTPSHVRQWRVGVNFFSPQGDGRWWHDHRSPGGILLSANSVAHMAKSGARANLASQLDVAAGIRQRPGRSRKVDSLRAALKYAMLTINRAQQTPSGRATFLRDLSPKEYATLSPHCPISPVSLPEELKLKDYTTYLGWYHTDVTVPSSYFSADVARPTRIDHPLELDFTYLFDPNIENPDFETMGAGERVE